MTATKENKQGAGSGPRLKSVNIVRKIVPLQHRLHLNESEKAMPAQQTEPFDAVHFAAPYSADHCCIRDTATSSKSDKKICVAHRSCTWKAALAPWGKLASKRSVFGDLNEEVVAYDDRICGSGVFGIGGGSRRSTLC
jgi:hypothetical protein